MKVPASSAHLIVEILEARLQRCGFLPLELSCNRAMGHLDRSTTISSEKAKVDKVLFQRAVLGPYKFKQQTRQCEWHSEYIESKARYTNA
jgi:hypothetical protein